VAIGLCLKAVNPRVKPGADAVDFGLESGEFGVNTRLESRDFGVLPVKQSIDLLIEGTKLLIHGDKPRIDHFEPSFHLLIQRNKSRIDQLEPWFHLLPQTVHVSAKLANVASQVGDGSCVVPGPSL
jgi:hypothetical protein